MVRVRVSIPLVLAVITVGIAIAIAASLHYDTRDPRNILFRCIHGALTYRYASGRAVDRHNRVNLSNEAKAFEDLLTLVPFKPSADDTATLNDIRTNTEAFRYILPNPPHCQRARFIADGNLTVQWHVLGNGINNGTAGVTGQRDVPTIMFMHGGGYIAGSLHSHDGVFCFLSRFMGIRVLGFEYRVAPEHPMPASIHDAARVYHWLLDTVGVQPNNVILMGDSAGGGGVLLLAQHLINTQQTSLLPAGIVAFSPFTDLAMTGDSWQSNVHVDDMLGPSRLLEFVRTQMVGGHLVPLEQQLDLKHPSISPLYGTFQGLPPIYISVGNDELLLDDSRSFAVSARAAHVSIHVSIVPYMEHDFAICGAAVVPEAIQELQKVKRWIHLTLPHGQGQGQRHTHTLET